MFVIKNTSVNKFVALPGRKNAFTTHLQHARTFRSYESAKVNCCGDEFPISVEACIPSPLD